MSSSDATGASPPDRARRLAQDLLERVARGEDPAGERAEARGVPLLADAFEVYMAANPNRAADTVRLYRQNLRVNLSDWLKRPLDTITRQDVEDRFNRITGKHGWSAANQTLSMLRSIYRRPCVDHESLRNPVELWLAAGGRFNRQRRRRISAPNEVLPRWRTGIEAADLEPAIRDIFLVGFYTGMRRGEILSLRWERVDLDRRSPSGSRKPRPGSRLSCLSLGNSPASSSGVWRTATARPRSGKVGCFHPPEAGRVMSWTLCGSTATSPKRVEPGSGSTGCATPSSRWPNGNSCCRAR